MMIYQSRHPLTIPITIKDASVLITQVTNLIYYIMEENRQLVGNICASIEELGNVIVDNVAASHKDYEIMIASLDNSIAEMKKRLGNVLPHKQAQTHVEVRPAKSRCDAPSAIRLAGFLNINYSLFIRGAHLHLYFNRKNITLKHYFLRIIAIFALHWVVLMEIRINQRIKIQKAVQVTTPCMAFAFLSPYKEIRYILERKDFIMASIQILRMRLSVKLEQPEQVKNLYFALQMFANLQGCEQMQCNQDYQMPPFGLGSLILLEENSK